jgi:hypothetical protein
VRTGTRSRIVGAVGNPGIRLQFDEFKRLLGLAADRLGAGDLAGHQEAALEAVALGNDIASAIRSQTGITLSDKELGKLLVNVAYDEMLTGVLAGHYVVPAFDVQLSAGRPAGRRSIARQAVLDAVAASPGMTDEDIARLGREFDPQRWPPEREDDYDSRRRRMARIRRDAAK